jgi:DNA-directed RNA polymerase sigma subunit (sigma70/sigma32)
MKKKENVVQRTTCFKEHESHQTYCSQENCKYWIDKEDSLNCSMIMAAKGPRTLQEIGDIFGVTRMRICQIEKSVIEKIKSSGKMIV